MVVEVPGQLPSLPSPKSGPLTSVLNLIAEGATGVPNFIIILYIATTTTTTTTTITAADAAAITITITTGLILAYYTPMRNWLRRGR